VNWSESYTVSRSIVLQIGDGGELLAGNSVSRMPQALAEDGLPVLLAFAGGRTPAKALERLRDEWEIDDAGFTGVVDALVAQNLLTPSAGNDAALATAGFASAFEHFRMVRDKVRVSAYRRAIFRHCRDKTETQLCRLDFRPGSSLAVEPRIDLRLHVVQAGALGGVLVYFRAHLDDDTVLGNSPDAPRTSWGWDARPLSRLVAVEPGQEIPLVSELRTNLGAQTLHIDLV